jgi:hypothetical protein
MGYDSDAGEHGLSTHRPFSTADVEVTPVAPPFDWNDYENVELRVDFTQLLKMSARTAKQFNGGDAYLYSGGWKGSFPLSYTCWFKSDKTGVASNPISQYDKDGTVDYFTLQLNAADNVSALTRSTSDAMISATTSGGDYQDDAWHFATAAAGTNLAVYVDDGTDNDSVSNTVSLENVDRASLGGVVNANPAGFCDDVALSQVAIWSIELSSDQHAWLYNSGDGRTLDDITTSQDANNPGLSNLRAFYIMDARRNLLVDQHGSYHMQESRQNIRHATFTAANSEYLSGSQTATNYPFTFNCWIRNTSTAQQVLMYMGDASAANVADLRINPTTSEILGFRRNSGGTFQATQTARYVQDGRWHMVTATFNTAQCKVYVDGALCVTETDSIAFSGSLDEFAIGSVRSTIDDLYADCDIAYASVYNSVLSDANVAYLYNRGRGRTFAVLAADGDAANPGSPDAGWELSETSGTRADSIGSNDLTDNATVTSGYPGPVTPENTRVDGNIKIPAQCYDTGIFIIGGYDAVGPGDSATWFRDLTVPGLTNYPVSISFWGASNCLEGGWFLELGNLLNTDGIRIKGPTYTGTNQNKVEAILASSGDNIAYETTEGTFSPYPFVGSHHIFVLVTSSKVRLWIDGVEQTEANHSASFPTIGTFYIGCYQNGSNTSSTIAIDEIGVWNADLSDYIDELYNGGIGLQYRDLAGAGVPLDDLFIYLPMDFTGDRADNLGLLNSGTGFEAYEILPKGSTYAGEVYELEESGANSYALFQADPDARPTAQQSAKTSNQICLVTDGVDDYMDTQGLFTAQLDQPTEIFCGLNVDTYSGTQTDFYDGYDATDRQKFSLNLAGVQYMWAGTVAITGGGTVETDEWHLHLHRFQDDAGYSWEDGEPRIVNQDCGAQSLDGFHIASRNANAGITYNAKARYGYLVVNKGTLTDAERNAIGQEVLKILDADKTWTSISGGPT